MSSLRTISSGGVGVSSIGSDRTGATSTTAGMSHSHSGSHRKHHHHRSRSAPRAPEKPPRKRNLKTGHSLASIPSQIKLSMLNSGLLSFGEFPPKTKKKNGKRKKIPPRSGNARGDLNGFNRTNNCEIFSTE